MIEQSLEAKISLFFDNPKSKPPHPKQFSSLHLLRRHIRICLCIDPIPEKDNKAIWPAAMATLAGIDLLGLYYSGKEKNTNETFRSFCTDFLNLSPEDSVVIYMLRCALMHTYGLFTVCNISRNINGKNYYNKKFNFTVYYEDFPWLIQKIGEDKGKETYHINLKKLYECFEISIDKYNKEIINNRVPKIQDNFEKIYNQVGIISG
jgi:hypothetical protein